MAISSSSITPMIPITCWLQQRVSKPGVVHPRQRKIAAVGTGAVSEFVVEHGKASGLKA
jgi:hypothetical protein